MVVRLSYVLPADQQLWRRGRSSAAISPDGRSIVYTASRQLFLRTMSDSEPRPISGPELDAGMPFFSPDGEWVGFWCARDSTLRKIRTAGGGAVTLASASNPRGASWLGDVIVVAEGGLGIVAVPPAGGPPAVWVLPDQDEVLTRPQLLPGADAVLFTAARVLGNRTVKSDVAVYSRSSGSRRVVITDAVGARYVPGGFIVYAAGGALFAVRFDLRSLRVTGRPIPIADDINRFEPNFDVARDGTLIYVHDDDEPRADTRLAIVDAGGTMQPIDLPPADYDTPRISPDAKRLAVDSGENDGTIWICDLEHASTPRRLTSQGHARSPVWSPDGTRIAYGSTRDGQVGIFVQRADGSGVAERVTAAEAGVEHVPGSWSHDGRLLAYASVKAGIKDTIWTVSMSDDHRTTRVLAVAGSNQMDPSISPDGQWIAYSSEGAAGESRLQVYVQPFPPTGEMVQISRDGGEMPTWSPDGRRLFYRPSESQALRSVSITTRPSFAAARAATFGRGLFVGGYDAVTGRRLVVVLAGEARDTRPAHPADRINVVMHWVDAMKGQTPTAAGVGEIARPHRNGA
jgi:serine/threonine-protein kinase